MGAWDYLKWITPDEFKKTFGGLLQKIEATRLQQIVELVEEFLTNLPKDSVAHGYSYLEPEKGSGDLLLKRIQNARYEWQRVRNWRRMAIIADWITPLLAAGVIALGVGGPAYSFLNQDPSLKWVPIAIIIVGGACFIGGILMLIVYLVIRTLIHRQVIELNLGED